MLHPKFQEKITPIRTNFSRSIRRERGENDQSKNDDSFDAIVACAVAHQGMAYSDFRLSNLSKVKYIMKELGMDKHEGWGCSPFEFT